MKKRINLLLVLLASFSIVGVTSIAPQKAVARGDLILSCSNGFFQSPQYQHVENHVVRQLVDVRLDQYYLDEVYVRISSFNGSQASVTTQFIKRDGPVIATKTLTAPPSTAWVEFDFTDAAIPRGVYYIQVSANSGQAGWEKAGSNCIDDSYAIVDGVSQDFDLGFGIYAYDTSTQQPPTGGNNGSGNQGGGNTTTPTTNPNGSGGTTGSDQLPPGGSSSSKTNLTATPTFSGLSDDEIRKMAAGTEGSFWPFAWLMLFSSPILSILFSLFSFVVFIGVIILIIWLIRRRGKKPDPTPPAQSATPRAEEKPSEDKENIKN